MLTKSATDGSAAAAAVHRQQSPKKLPQSHPPPPSPSTTKKRAAAPADAELPPSSGAPTPAKFRKRQSSCYAHMNVRDPLNLGSVRPDNPDDPNFAKPIQLILTNVNDPLNLQNLSAVPVDALPTAAEPHGQKRKRRRNRAPVAARDESDEPDTADDDLSSPPGSAAPVVGDAITAVTTIKRRFTWMGGTTTVADDQPATLVSSQNAEEDEAQACAAVDVEQQQQPSTSARTTTTITTTVVVVEEEEAETEVVSVGATRAEAAPPEAGDAAARWERRRKMAERFRYGNFNHYQMRRAFRLAATGVVGAAVFDTQQHQQQQTLLQAVEDPRVRFFCPDWFMDKAVLDIGSNAGHFAISLARAFQPRRVVGVDIDSHLVGAARKNIRHFCDKDTKMSGKFPASFGANFGPISAPSTSDGPHFPDNVWFFCENYVLPSDAALENVHEEFDIIFALACSKWVHLNWGDAGIKRFFLRAFRQLRTGGRFVLETAPFKDYRKHCKRTAADRPPAEVLRHFGAMRLHPDEFTAFLLATVGFSHHEELDSAHSKALGISGRLQVFYKGQFMLMGSGDDASREANNGATADEQQQQQ